MEGEYTFDKKEISKILKKASEIQTRKELYGNKEGLTKQELVQLATEVGIDEESLLEAIDAKELPDFDNSFNWLKGTSKVQAIEVIDGEISDQNWDDVIREIRKVTGGIGKDSNNRSSFEWEQRLKEIGYRHISLTPQNGKTRVQYIFNWPGIKFISTFFSFLMAFMITAVSFDGTDVPSAISLLISGFVGIGGIFVGRIFLKSYFERQKKQLHTVLTVIKKSLSSSLFLDFKKKVYAGEEPINPASRRIRS